MPDAVTEIEITKVDKGDDIDSKEKEKKAESSPEDKAEESTEAKEPAQSQPKQRSVSFNRDVHVKRFGKTREPRGSPGGDYQLRKEPFTHLSEKELLDEAAKVIAQADSVSCTADHPPEKFFSLPHRKKLKVDLDKNSGRRNSADLGEQEKKSLGRSTSDVGTPRKRGKERTSLSTLFRRAKTTSPDRPVVVTAKPELIVTTKPGVIVQRSKSDVSDLKSNTSLNAKPKPIRKRSGSESEEFLKSLRNKKTQLSPIIETSPRIDYFLESPLKTKQKIAPKSSTLSALEESKQSENSSHKVNPIEKPPRFKSPDKHSSDPKPPARIKRSKAVANLSNNNKFSKEPPITDTPKRKTEIKKTLLVDEIDQIRDKDINQAEIKDRIKESILKLQNNIYGGKEMIHSSQQPPDKPPLTKGHTVDHIVKILKEDQFSPPPKAHLIIPSNKASNNNQPFSYTRPSVSPDPNLYIRPSSPEQPPTPVNKMYPDKGVVYAQVVRNQDNGTNSINKQTVHKTFSASKGNRYGQNSDEDEGLGHEDHRNKYSTRIKYDYDKHENGIDSFKVKDTHRTLDSPITPRFREYKPAKFEEFEPTYANEFAENSSRDFIKTTFRGRADGMDSKRRASIEPDTTKIDRSDLNDLSQRRQLLESRMNARRVGDKNATDKPITKYLIDNDPISEAENRMKATEKYVNETARYYRHTLERDGYVENSISDTYSKIDSENNNKVKYNTGSRTVEKIKHSVLDPRDNKRFQPLDAHKLFPPEPEYEPPSLESNISIDKKYKSKSKQFTSSHDALHTGQKYSKIKDDKFGKRKGHYASNPEIVQEREEIYENAKYDPKYADTFHNSLRRDKNSDRHYNNTKFSREERSVTRHDSDETRNYKYDLSPRSRFDIDRDRDNRFVDSGIENDFRKDSSGEINRSSKIRTYHIKNGPNHADSDEDGCTSSLFIANERRHTEDNYPSEQIYANGDYHNYHRKDKYTPRERSIDDGSHYDPRIDRLEHSPVRRNEDKVSAKPPKPAKKLSGLEKVKQLFSSSKKSKKETEIQTKPRTRVLKSPEHLAQSDYRDYDDDRRLYREPSDRPRYDDKDDLQRRYKEYRGSSEDRDSDHRSPKPSDVGSVLKSRETSRQTRSRTTDPVDSPRLAERYSHRRRLATPSPTPSPPRRRVEPPRAAAAPPPDTSAGNWFKSLDRLTRKRNKTSKVDKESGATTEDESTVNRKTWMSKSKPQNSPAKNLRFFGDTDQDSDANVLKHTVVTKSKSHPQNKTSLRKTISNSSNGIDEIDRAELSKKSYSLSNLREDSPKRVIAGVNEKYKRHGRNLHNISEIHSNSETESQFEDNHLKPRRNGKLDLKPPMSPYDRRSRSHSSSKNVVAQKSSRGDLRRNGYNSSRSELRGEESRGSSSELRISKERNGTRGDLKSRRRTPGAQSGESSTEGESSHQSQRSVVYLHATTVGDIPDPARARGRSRDDVSSVNSSHLQVKTVARSFSLLAPWRPRHHAEPYDVHYAQTARPNKRTHKQASPKNDSFFGKSKSSSTKNINSGTLQKNRSTSQTTLNRKKPTPSRLSSSSNTLYKKSSRNGNSSSKENVNTVNIKPSTLSRSRNDRDYKKSMSTEVLTREREPERSEREKISRSISMPKDNSKKAGWFKLTKNKKAEQTSRVR